MTTIMLTTVLAIMSTIVITFICVLDYQTVCGEWIRKLCMEAGSTVTEKYGLTVYHIHYYDYYY